ncbi:hypothetical protein ODU14_07480 [Streptococcus suis]|uniref:DUF3278 domain-containing protein n=1 Tax=Streptococcus suis TaxID=1307 RepID=A0A0Z8ICB2_STRSU|nr:DUF6773 family protein [Streptococcus suis]NQN11206.1 hypothetical protein [Streptococcus suis]NQN69855.1 hypothetical protein [Streptococcus suis]NQN71951.1 hypothetical protein [Streptococcus suis]NQN74080.1 hypothetical protein [Streptococcus suis]NQN78534.1 hypothetical protein [Streptococcus suis]
MKKIVTDERVQQEENQVFAWVGRTMNILLPLSFLIKSLVLKWTFDTYVFELIAMFVVSVYLFYGYWKKGLDMERGTTWQAYLYLGGVIAGKTIVMAWINYQTYGQHYSGIWDWHFWVVILIFLVSVTCLYLLLLNILSWANKYRQKQVEKELEEGME